MGQIVSRSEFAVILGVSHQQVGVLAKRGMPEVVAGRAGVSAEIDTEAAIKWWVDYNVNQAVAQYTDNGEGRTTLQAENVRLVAAKAEKTELEVKQLRGELLNDEVVDQALQASMVVINTQLRSFGSRLAGELAGMTDSAAIRELLNEEVRRVLTSAAESVAHLADDQIAILSAEAAAESEAEPVG